MASPSRFQKLRGTDAHSSRVQDAVSHTLEPIANGLNGSPIMGVKPVWLPLQPATGFSNFGAFAQIAYYVDSLMRVWVRGDVFCVAGCATGTVVTTLPSGARPKFICRKAVEGTGATVQFLGVAPNGNVTVDVVVAAGGNLSVDFSILAEQ